MLGREIYFVLFWDEIFFVTHAKKNIKKTLNTICVKDTKYNLFKNVM